MTTLEMLNALPGVQKLMDLKLPVKKAFKVYSLAKQINEQKDFFINEEKKLIDAHQGVVLENGRIQFESKDAQENFAKEHELLMQYEVKDLDVLELSFSDLKDVELTPAEIGMLDGIVNFID